MLKFIFLKIKFLVQEPLWVQGNWFREIFLEIAVETGEQQVPLSCGTRLFCNSRSNYNSCKKYILTNKDCGFLLSLVGSYYYTLTYSDHEATEANLKSPYYLDLITLPL